MAAQVDLEDSNCALIGSDLDKAAREAAASCEAHWEGCGQAVGIEIWRVENTRNEDGSPNFGINKWAKENYGDFFRGDSYIVLKTTKVEDKLCWDIFFWIGSESSQDEYGVAAYKAVELDDLLGGAPIQHREVEGFESAAFVPGCFPKGINYMDGGVASGFRSVAPESYEPRLFQCRKMGNAVRNFQVPLARSSLNQGDAFVLDAGLTVYTWFGEEASPFERQKAGNSAANIVNARNGKAKQAEVDSHFWEYLGGEGDIAGPIPHEEFKEVKEEPKMFIITDKDSVVRTSEIKPASRDALSTDDAFIIDSGSVIWVWIGTKASKREHQESMIYATKHMSLYSKPPSTRIVRVLEGQEGQTDFFAKAF